MHLIYNSAKIVSKFSPWAGNKLILKSAGSPCLAHHGLQRSGTNYLNQCLIRLGIYPLNTFDEKRSSPRHKHCRWYADKSAIPSFLVYQYGNDYFAKDLHRINQVCGYPSDTIHFVVYKSKKDWLVSILNWGWRCGWFSSEFDARDSIHQLSRDYDCFLSFWRELREKNPGSVALALFDDISGNSLAFQAELNSIGVFKNLNNFDGIIDHLPQSPTNRHSKFDSSDIPESFSHDQIFS